MGPIAILAIFAICIFVGVVLVSVETLRMRLILFGIAGVIWFVFGLLGTMIATAILSVGILIGSQIPTVSKL